MSHEVPEAQTEDRDDAQFWKVRGQSLKTEFTYTKCGHVNLQDSKFCDKYGHALVEPTPQPASTKPASPIPTSLASGRCQVREFLGEGGTKKISLAHSEVLDPDVALSPTQTEESDCLSSTRIKGEAHAIGPLDQYCSQSRTDYQNRG